MSGTAAQRLSRLLGLVPYLLENPGAELSRTAEVFGVSTDELIDDLQLLFVTGRPGRMPDDLIEAGWEDGRIHVGNADEVSVPVRLTRDEASSLLVAFDYLAQLRPEHSGTIDGLRAKITAAAGLDDVTATLDVRPPEIEPASARLIREAIEEGADLELDYYVPSRDQLTTRIVAPRALRLSGQWYLDAWCRNAQDDRSFALTHVRRLERPAGDQRGAAAGASGTAAGDPGSAGTGLRADTTAPEVVRLQLAPGGAWLADELDPLERIDDVPVPGGVEISLTVHSRSWLTRFLLQHGRHVLGAWPGDIVDEALAEIRAALR